MQSQPLSHAYQSWYPLQTEQAPAMNIPVADDANWTAAKPLVGASQPSPAPAPPVPAPEAALMQQVVAPPARMAHHAQSAHSRAKLAVLGGVIGALGATAAFVVPLTAALLPRAKSALTKCLLAQCIAAFGGQPATGDYANCTTQLRVGTLLGGGDIYLDFNGNSTWFGDVACLDKPYNLLDVILFVSIFGGIAALIGGSVVGCAFGPALGRCGRRDRRHVPTMP